MASAWESFHFAMLELAGADSQRERLIKAYKSNLMRLAKKNVPVELRSEFTRLVQEIERRPAKYNECTVKNTVDAMDEKEVVAMINSIIRMYDAVTRYQPILSSAT
ncbi:MAG: hypothetical protein V4632_08375 [Pseudomonadota bacterium]